MKQRSYPVFWVLFFLSGFSGLIYEVLWVRMFSLVFGTTVFAVSTVLTAFFAGLALGSLIFGKLVDRHGKPLLFYGLLEIGIGVYSLFLPAFLSCAQDFYPEWSRYFSGSFYVLSLTRFVICFLLILPPTTLMGATLPVLSKFIVDARERVGKDVGYLYALNAIGASAGCFAAGFLFIEALGISGTHTLAVILSLMVGALALGLRRTTETKSISAPQATRAPSFTANAERAGRLRRSRSPKRYRQHAGAGITLPEYPPRLILMTLGAFAVSGAAALAYEVLWTRHLGVTFQSTTYSFTLILTAFLFGLGAGSYLFGRCFQRPGQLILYFGAMQIAIGLYALGLIHLFRAAPDLASRLIQPTEAAWWEMIALQMLSCLVVMLIPTLLLGALFPLASRICASSMEKLGKTIGHIYAVNSAGAIVGSFLAGFVLIPLIGVKNGMMAAASVHVLAGLVVLGSSPTLGKRPKRTAAAATVVITGMGLWAGGMTDSHVGIGASNDQRRILYYEDGLAANVRVEQTADNVSLLIDNKVQSGRRGARSSQGLGHLSMLLHPRPRRVLTIGMGAGMTAGAVSKHPVESIEIVDLIAELAKTAPFFSKQNHDVLQDPRTSFLVGDGRNYLLNTGNRYDVIISDIFFPAGAGTGTLYSLEHYQLARERLRREGIMVQWLTLYQLTEDEFKVIAATFQTVFPHVELWLGDPDMMFPVVGLVGREMSPGIDLPLLRRRLARREVFEELVYGDDAFSLLCSFLMSGNALSEYSGNVPLNTDNRPRIEFSTPRNNYANRRLGWETIQKLAALKKSVVPLLDLEKPGAEDRAKTVRQLQRREAARKHFYRGTFALGEGRAEEGLQEYQEARSLAPRDAFVDFHTSESIGRLHAKMGHRERAVNLLESAARLRPAETDPRLQLAELYAGSGRWIMAERHLEEIVRRHPENALALGRLGDIYARRQKWEEARAVLGRALDILPAADPQILQLYERVSERLFAAPQP